MVYRIHKVADEGAVVLKLSGWFRSEDVAELERLVDQDVVRFLERCETNGARLRSCPPYIRQWIAQEHERRSQV